MGSHSRYRRRTRNGDVDRRVADFFRPARSRRHRTLVALPTGRRLVYLDQASLRGIRRLHDRMDLLVERSSLLADHSVLRSREYTLSRRLSRSFLSWQQYVLHRLLARRTFSLLDSEFDRR